MTQQTWTDERIEQLKTLVIDGCSASGAAATLGVTRNAVIGKVHRLGLTLKGSTGPAKARPYKKRGQASRNFSRRIEKAIGDATARRAPIMDLEPEIVANPIALAALELHHCRWPVEGAGLLIMFCGGQAHDKLSYCLRHCRMAYRPPERRSPAQRQQNRLEMARAVNASRIATAGEWQ